MVLNEGLPRTAALIIGNKATRSLRQRLSFSTTMIVVQTTAGALLAAAGVLGAQQLAALFVPQSGRAAAIGYVRVSALSALSSSIEVRKQPTRSLPKSSAASGRRCRLHSSARSANCSTLPIDGQIRVQHSARFAFCVALSCSRRPADDDHAGARPLCVRFDGGTRRPRQDRAKIASSKHETKPFFFWSSVFFVYLARRALHEDDAAAVASSGSTIEAGERVQFSIAYLRVMARAAAYTLFESALRNAIYLWLIAKIVKLGDDYATGERRARRYFAAIGALQLGPFLIRFDGASSWQVAIVDVVDMAVDVRDGLQVPVQALQASALIFVGHNFGAWRSRAGEGERRASRREIIG